MQPTIFYLCNDPERALGLEKVLSNYHIVCTDNNPMVDALIADGVKIFSLARHLQEDKPIFRNSNRLLQHSAVQQYIKENTPPNETPNIMVFKIAPNIERSATTLGYKVLNTSAELNRKFENKIPQYQTLTKEGVNFPKTVITNLANATYEGLTKELGEDIVIQFNRGHTGLGTIFLRDGEHLEKLAANFRSRDIRAAQKIEGQPWTINACVTRHGVVHGGLSYQITGVEGITDQLGGTVGNDWSKLDMLSSELKNQIDKETIKIGEAIAKEGYKGLFGVDFITTDSGELYTIEVNARQPASTGIHNKMMLQDKRVPLSMLHIAEFLYDDDNTYRDFIKIHIGNDVTRESLFLQNRDEMNSRDVSQIIIRKLLEKESIDLSKHPAGIYEGTKHLKDGYSIEQLGDPKEMLLLKQFNDELVSKGHELARVQAITNHEEVLKAIQLLQQ